jgi:hypothetical protein
VTRSGLTGKVTGVAEFRSSKAWIPAQKANHVRGTTHLGPDQVNVLLSSSSFCSSFKSSPLRRNDYDHPRPPDPFPEVRHGLPVPSFVVSNDPSAVSISNPPDALAPSFSIHPVLNSFSIGAGETRTLHIPVNCANSAMVLSFPETNRRLVLVDRK